MRLDAISVKIKVGCDTRNGESLVGIGVRLQYSDACRLCESWAFPAVWRPFCPRSTHGRKVDTGQPSFFTLGEDEALFCRPAQGNHAHLSENAHGMYQVHGVFVIWLQYLLSGVALLALRKAVCRVPVGPHIAAGERPVRACAS